LGYYSACFKTKNRIANNTNTWTNQGAAGWLSITTNGQTNTLHGYTGDSVWAELRSETSTSYPPTASAAAHVRGRRCDERLSVAFLRQVIEYAAVVSVIDKLLQPQPTGHWQNPCSPSLSMAAVHPNNSSCVIIVRDDHRTYDHALLDAST
jgi:hypothetical protein